MSSNKHYSKNNRAYFKTNFPELVNSQRKIDDFLFGRKYESNDIHNKSQYFNENAPGLVYGQSNRQYQRGNVILPTQLPPVPVVLDPIPKQITPIGTIPIYSRRSSTTSQLSWTVGRGREYAPRLSISHQQGNIFFPFFNEYCFLNCNSWAIILILISSC